MTKPKPVKPSVPETPATPPPQANEPQPQGGDDGHEKAAAADGSSTEAAPATAEPMETDKPETTPAA